MNTTTQTPRAEVTAFTRQFAVDMMNDELETLLALSICLANHLEPQDPKNPKDKDDLTAWRMAEVLRDRLSERQFSDAMRHLVLGEPLN